METGGNIKFVDDADIKQLGELSIDIGRPFQQVEDKTVKVTLLFGATHIYVTATNREREKVQKFATVSSNSTANDSYYTSFLSL